MKKLLILSLFVSLNVSAQRFVKSYSTLAELLAVNPNDVHTNAFVTDLVSAGDNLGGFFTYRASSAVLTNTSSIYKPNNYSGRWIANYFPLNSDGGPLNVKNYGALGNGTTNDTAAIQSALTAAAGNALYFPPGTYLMSTGVSVLSNTKVYGAGSGSTIISLSNGNQGFLIAGRTNVSISDLWIKGPAIQAIGTSTSTNVVIRDCIISGITNSPTALLPNGGIVIGSGADYLLQNIRFFSNGWTIAASGTNLSADILTPSGSYVTRLKIKDNWIDETAVGIPIQLYDARIAEISGNYINQGNFGLYDAGGNDATGYGILSYGSAGRPQEIRILNNYITNCAGSGVYTTSSDDVSIIGNQIYNTGLQKSDGSVPTSGIVVTDFTGLRISDNQIVGTATNRIVSIGGYNNAMKVVISDNVMAGSYLDGLRISGAPRLANVTVTGNVITNVGSYCIKSDGVLEYATITGNLLNNAVNGGISADVISHSTISGNTIIEAGGSAGILIVAGTNNVIAANNIQKAAATGSGISYRGNDSVLDGNRITGFATKIAPLGTGNANRNLPSITSPGAYPYQIVFYDNIIAVNSTSAREIKLPDPQYCNGQPFWVKDLTGYGATNNITVWVSTGGLIDAATNFVMNANSQSKGFVSSGTNFYTLP